jgi:hypothetical protein
MSHLCWIDGDLEMANQDKQDVNKRIQKEMRDMRNKLKKEGYDAMEIDSIMRDFFAKKKTPAKKTMTANKGGMAKAAKKMMRGGMVKKKMRGGGMAKMAQKKMMRGGMAKKKMMRGGAVKKK